MIKLSLVCDGCGAIIAEGISANEVRLESDALYRRHDGKELCPQCKAFLLPGRTHRRQKQNLA
jgi:RNase P subunit RPR2